MWLPRTAIPALSATRYMSMVGNAPKGRACSTHQLSQLLFSSRGPSWERMLGVHRFWVKVNSRNTVDWIPVAQTVTRTMAVIKNL